MISLSQSIFEEIVDDAVAAVPKKFLEKLDNVAIVIEDYPRFEQLRNLGIKNSKTGGRPFLLLGLYQGVPQTKRWGGGAFFPDKITIYKKPIEYLASSKEDVLRIVINTVKHEIAHHFGMKIGRAHV